MTWVKICGITNLEDALVAVDAGADAVGFVFYEKSPRFVSVETARGIIRKLPDSVDKVGVFVLNARLEFGSEFIGVALTATQSHPLAGELSKNDRLTAPGFGRSLFPTLKKAVVAVPAENFSDESAEKLVASFGGRRSPGDGQPAVPAGFLDTLLLDSGGLREPGGTGKTFNWEKARSVVTTLQEGGLKTIVAGGLTWENVGYAIALLHPWGVDVASGVETRPGKKDPEKVRAFVRAVRECDAKGS
jgi:phosphoribosylanthranilate isomerase